MNDLELEKAKALALAEMDEDQEEDRTVSSGRKNYAPTVEEMDQARADVEPTTGEAMAGGFIEGVPFMKDTVAAYDAMAEEMDTEGFSFDDAYSKYKDKLEDTNQDLTNAQNQAPLAFGAGEMGGTAASLAVGGAALKGTQLGAGLTTLGQGITTGTAVGAAQGLSRSRDRSAGDFAQGAALGAVSEVGGHYIGKGLKAGAKFVSDSAKKAYYSSMGYHMGFKTKTLTRELNKHLARTGQSNSDMLESIVSKKYMNSDDALINLSDAPEVNLSKIDDQIGYVGEQIEEAYNAIPDNFDTKLNLASLKGNLRKRFASVSSKTTATKNQIDTAADMASEIDVLGSNVLSSKTEISVDGTKKILEEGFSDTMSIRELAGIKTALQQEVKNSYKSQTVNSLTKKKQEMATYISSLIDDNLKKIDDGGAIYKNIKSLNKEYGNLNLTQKAFSELNDSVSKPHLVTFTDVMAGSLGALAGPYGTMTAIAATRAAKHPMTPVYLRQGLEKLAPVLEAAPTGRIASMINTATRAGVMELNRTLYGVVAETNLKSSPIERTYDSVVEKQEDVRNLIKFHQPETVEDFDEALIKGKEATSAFMDGISKIPEMEDLFAAGVGFDGKVYNPEDKATLELQLKQADMPGAQRIQWINDLRSNGIIPDMNAIVEPVPQKHVPRTKKIHDY